MKGIITADVVGSTKIPYEQRGMLPQLSMVGATFPTAPSVRITKSRQFSMTKMHKDN